MSVIKLKSNLNLQTSECRNMVANDRNLNQQTSNGQRNRTTNNSESDTGNEDTCDTDQSQLQFQNRIFKQFYKTNSFLILVATLCFFVILILIAVLLFNKIQQEPRNEKSTSEPSSPVGLSVLSSPVGPHTSMSHLNSSGDEEIGLRSVFMDYAEYDTPYDIFLQIIEDEFDVSTPNPNEECETTNGNTNEEYDASTSNPEEEYDTSNGTTNEEYDASTSNPEEEYDTSNGTTNEEYDASTSNSEEENYTSNETTNQECDTSTLNLIEASDIFPEIIKDYKSIFITNLLLLIIVGGLGNMITLSSVCYVFYWPEYRKQFPFMWNSNTILLMHLSLCDMLYCTLGLPFILAIFISEGLPFPKWVCWFTALIRHLFVYADFLTLGLIAITRLIGIRRNLRSFSHSINQGLLSGQATTILCCMFTWFIAFFIISGIIFEVNSKALGINFGKFGYAAKNGLCNSVGAHGGAIVYTAGFFIPFLTISISYILLALYVNKFRRQFLRGLSAEEKSQQPSDTSGSRENQANMHQLHRTLMLLTLTYVVFCGTLLPVEWAENYIELKEVKQNLTVIVYQWYFWVYAVNNIVYMLSLPVFRKIWLIFLTDIICYMRVSISSSLFIIKRFLTRFLPNRQRSFNLKSAVQPVENHELESTCNKSSNSIDSENSRESYVSSISSLRDQDIDGIHYPRNILEEAQAPNKFERRFL